MSFGIIPDVTRSLLQRLHNPSGRECGCLPECWCKRTALGRALRWYVPRRHHSPVDPDWKRSQVGWPTDDRESPRIAGMADPTDYPELNDVLRKLVVGQSLLQVPGSPN